MIGGRGRTLAPWAAALAACVAGGLGAESALGLEPGLGAVAVGVEGVLLAWLVRVPAGSLVGPARSRCARGRHGAVPGRRATGRGLRRGSLVVGASVGLRFDRESLRHAGRLAPAMGAAVGAALTLGCAALGVLVLVALDTDPLTAYLATAPGGISSVLAVAFDSGADLPIVVAVQTLRFLLLALAAPFAARLVWVHVPR